MHKCWKELERGEIVIPQWRSWAEYHLQESKARQGQELPSPRSYNSLHSLFRKSNVGTKGSSEASEAEEGWRKDMASEPGVGGGGLRETLDCRDWRVKIGEQGKRRFRNAARPIGDLGVTSDSMEILWNRNGTMTRATLLLFSHRWLLFLPVVRSDLIRISGPTPRCYKIFDFYQN